MVSYIINKNDVLKSLMYQHTKSLGCNTTVHRKCSSHKAIFFIELVYLIVFVISIQRIRSFSIHITVQLSVRPKGQSKWTHKADPHYEPNLLHSLSDSEGHVNQRPHISTESACEMQRIPAKSLVSREDLVSWSRDTKL